MLNSDTNVISAKIYKSNVIHKKKTLKNTSMYSTLRDEIRIHKPPIIWFTLHLYLPLFYYQMPFIIKLMLLDFMRPLILTCKNVLVVKYVLYE